MMIDRSIVVDSTSSLLVSALCVFLSSDQLFMSTIYQEEEEEEDGEGGYSKIGISWPFILESIRTNWGMNIASFFERERERRRMWGENGITQQNKWRKQYSNPRYQGEDVISVLDPLIWDSGTWNWQLFAWRMSVLISALCLSVSIIVIRHQFLIFFRAYILLSSPSFLCLFQCSSSFLIFPVFASFVLLMCRLRLWFTLAHILSPTGSLNLWWNCESYSSIYALLLEAWKKRRAANGIHKKDKDHWIEK